MTHKLNTGITTFETGKIVEVTKFRVGKTYMARSIGDRDIKIFVTIAKRTAKFVTTTDGERFGIRTRDVIDRNCEVAGEVETIRPWGTFSMAPTIRASSIVVEPPTPETEEDPDPFGDPECRHEEWDEKLGFDGTSIVYTCKVCGEGHRVEKIN